MFFQIKFFKGKPYKYLVDKSSGVKKVKYVGRATSKDVATLYKGKKYKNYAGG